MPTTLTQSGYTDSVRYNRRANGTVDMTTETGQYALRVSTNYPSTTRRPFPVDGWAQGTNRTFTKTELRQLTVGLQTINSSSWRVALPARWWVGTAFMSPLDPSSLHGLIRKKIKDQNLNLAQSFGEYKQTANLFSGLAKDIVGAYRSARNGTWVKNMRRFRRRSPGYQEREFANRWLAFQYGIKPLVSDIYGSCVALQKAIQEGRFIYVTVSREEESRDYQSSVVGGNTVGQQFGVHRARATIRARYKISQPAIKQLAEVGITNPALLAWELIPYSFVIDWALNVGEWLSSLDALVGTSEFSYYTIQETRAFAYGSTYGGKFEQVGFTYNRIGPRSDLPLPRLGYKPSTSLTAVANGLALIRQGRKGVDGWFSKPPGYYDD